MLPAYFVEEEDEVDGEGDKQRQEAQVVEVPGQVVLSKKWMWNKNEIWEKLFGQKQESSWIVRQS